MMDKKRKPTKFTGLDDTDKDLTMFTITNLVLTNEDDMVHMTLKLKRKVVTELLTTYLPTILLLLITFVTIFFDKDLFGDVIAVNLTIMLVMTTIFTSKIEELPPTSDMKMIDIWLIFCLVVPFLEVILRTAMECMNCSCQFCEPTDANKAKDEKEDKTKGGMPSKEILLVRLHVSGLVLEPRWLLNRLKTVLIDNNQVVIHHKSSPARF